MCPSPVEGLKDVAEVLVLRRLHDVQHAVHVGVAVGAVDGRRAVPGQVQRGTVALHHSHPLPARHLNHLSAGEDFFC